MACWTARGANLAAECEDADRFDRGPTHLHKPCNTRTNIASQTMSMLLKHFSKDKAFFHFKRNDQREAFSFLHVEKTLCKHISSDPVWSYI